MRVLSMIVLMTLFGASAVLPGQAQQENWSRCKSDDPDRKIGGCSAVIQSGQETGTNLANAFRGRGSAYAHKGDYDRAFQDYDQALKLNPNDAKRSTAGAPPTGTRVTSTVPFRTTIKH